MLKVTAIQKIIIYFKLLFVVYKYRYICSVCNCWYVTDAGQFSNTNSWSYFERLYFVYLF